MTVSPVRAQPSAHLAPVGATERTICDSPTAFGRFHREQLGSAKEWPRNNYSVSFTPHLNPLPRYSLRGGGEETNEEVISEPFQRIPCRRMTGPITPECLAQHAHERR